LKTNIPSAADANAPAAQSSRPLPEAPVDIDAGTIRWGSDAIALMLRELDIPYLALNPGASYRGLHDSLVNVLGNERPQMLLCLHEESAVSIAQGFAKVTGRMMGVVLHSNVGLMHGTMSIFNAWCNRVPMLLLGATGPVDSARRRPWIDWIHTAADQGALIRDYTKWDDQPGSIPAALEALARAVQLAATAPHAPVYVNFDAALQEAELAEPPRLPDVARFGPPSPARPDAVTLADAVRRLDAAVHPVLLAGRVSRSEAAWDVRVALAERLQARVITDLKIGAAFPTGHPLHCAPPGAFLAAEAIATLREADVVLALDWVDLAGTLKQAFGSAAPPCAVINVSLDAQLARGWSKDHFGLPPADVYLACDPDIVVTQLAAALAPRDAKPLRAICNVAAGPAQPGATLTLATLAAAVNAATRDIDVCVTALPLGWHGSYRHFRHPLDYIGLEGGGGVGAGPGIAVGAALALKGSGRLPLAIVGDGDFLMGVTALWTAVHYQLPCLIIVANNRSFYNDELHQERVAKMRGRTIANKWIGQRIADPDIDLAAMGRAQGAHGIGPVASAEALTAALTEGMRRAAAGAVVVIDARVMPGYDANPSGASPAAATARGSGG
jgi:thiamine pyrophosphate-dependent acetolactate synthase large subunit-like protein